MITTVKDWSIVTVKDELSPFKILWAIVDESNRFKRGEYVCSSLVLTVKGNLVTTKSGSIYRLVGRGNEYTASYAQLLLLIDGFSPQEICK